MNHYIELGESEDGKVYLSIHSGSRNFGLKVCKYHNSIASKQTNENLAEFNKAREYIIATSDKKDINSKLKELKSSMDMGMDKVYLRGEAMFNYCIDMIIAQYYAELNRRTMLASILKVCNLQSYESFDTIHNYVDFDHFIIRKGAISAQEGEKCAIPLNMRDGVLLCIGKGNDDWNCSAPHGAGRILSRSEAKRTLDIADFDKSMEGIVSTSVNQFTLDESPMAYKDANMIMSAITPTVEIIEIVKPILNIKSND